MVRADGAMQSVGRWLAKNYAAALAVVTGLLLGMMYMVSGLGGDDWAAMALFGRYDGFAEYDEGILISLLKFPFQYWAGTNGRAANYLAIYLGSFLPVWVLHLLMGLGVIALSMFTQWAAGTWRIKGYQLLGALASFVIMFGLPWADEMFTYDMAFNYMMASAMVLCFVWLIARERNIWLWIVVCVGLLSGAMHEAAGFPVACGAALYFICHRTEWRVLSRKQQCGWVAFTFGALTTVLSPGIWHRAMSTVDETRTWSVWESLVFSAPILVALFGVMAFIGVRILFGRNRRCRLFDGLTVIFTVGAFVSGLFCMAGDFVGRVGWCAQLYAMIALWRMAGVSVRISRYAAGYIATLVGIIIVLHGILTIPVLAEDGRLERDIARQAGVERSTILYVDLPDVMGQPWYTIGKLRSLYGTHTYYIECISRYYDLPPSVLVPKAFEGIDLDTLSNEITDPEGRYRLSPMPMAPVTGNYRRTAIWSDDIAADTAVMQFVTPSGRHMWLAMPHCYNFYLW